LDDFHILCTINSHNKFHTKTNSAMFNHKMFTQVHTLKVNAAANSHFMSVLEFNYVQG